MYRVLQIANYVIHVALDKGLDITNLHLQKVLYYLQAESLSQTGEPLFDGILEKWRLGPVAPTVYHEYKEFGSQPIREIADEIVFDEDTMNVAFVPFNVDDITVETQEHINPLIVRLLNFKPFDLVDRTHEDGPWKKFKSEIEKGDRNLQYTNEEIYEYFTQHPERLEVVFEGALEYETDN